MKIRMAVAAACTALLWDCSSVSLPRVQEVRSVQGSGEGSASHDISTHKIFVADQSTKSIRVYDSTATGDTAPLYRIYGSQTGLNVPTFLAFDSSGDLYVTNFRSVTEYSPTANGNAKPIATISGPATQLSNPQGIAVDSGGNIYVAVWASSDRYIIVFPKGANGNVPPSQTIHDSIGLAYIAGLAVHGATIYAAVKDDRFNNPAEINEYPANANGTVVASAQIGGLNTPIGVAVKSDGKIVVADKLLGLDSIMTFAADANGNVRPLRKVEGPATRLNEPFGVAIGSDALFVVNVGYSAVSSYSIAANGNTKPLTYLAGLATHLKNPVGIAFR